MAWYEISSSHGGEYEAQNLLGCTAVFLIECRLTFQRYMLSPLSGWWVSLRLMMETARTSETSVDIQLRTRQYFQKDSELQVAWCSGETAVDIVCHKNLKCRAYPWVTCNGGDCNNSICHCARWYRPCLNRWALGNVMMAMDFQVLSICVWNFLISWMNVIYTMESVDLRSSVLWCYVVL
jgi:hypothetical protein